MPKTPILGITAAIALFAVSGCGSSSSPYSSASTATTTASATTSAATTNSSAATTPASGTTGAGALKLAADPEGQLKFDTGSLTTKAGRVSIDFANVSPVPHNLTIASSSGTVVGATPTFQGASKTLTVNLAPGTYTFYCSVPGHRQAGMVGTLTVH
ncbi:MAG TPA: plastocyanin/azurin family copper-binding protein [Solirubrobacteraceae bacterium]|jgi:plastocyanin|nr:plastocyanin/azurin family copper-binding protein [Solirubrobacteraceae bacterium]